MAIPHFGRLIPFLMVIVAAFAILQLYTAIMYAGSRQYAFAAFYVVFGFAGMALARALWVHRGKIARPDGGSS